MTLKNKVKTVIKLPMEIIQKVRNILKAGVSLTDLSTNEISDEQSRTTTQVNSESLEDATSLDWEDFTPNKDDPNEPSLVDSEHLASLIKRYEDSGSDSDRSVFSRTSDEVTRWRLKIKLLRTSSDSWKLSYVSDS